MGIFDKAGSKRIVSIMEGVNSIVGEKSTFKGEFTSAGSFHINGEFEGKVSVGGEVIVSSAARVMGEIEGNSIVISGRVDGNVKARETLEITKSGRVNGDLTAQRINIEDGALYHGRVTVQNGNQPDQQQNS
jgi:cytoskeletal protein CcmA (bactofilin family)